MKWVKFISSMMLILNVWIIWMYARLFYVYHFTDVLFAFKISDWVLFLYILIGLMGIYAAFQIAGERWSVKKGILLNLVFILLAIAIEQLTIQ